ncbi:MAG: glycerol kinase GlpK [Cyclobacteriaceae bacterium]
MKYVLALDQGTTSSRSLIFDRQGSIVSTAQQEFKQYFPQSGWVEHDALEIYDTQMKTLRQAVDRIDISEIGAMAITNQRETIVVWDKQTGEPIHKAIVWQDRRTAGFCEELKKRELFDTIREKTGLPIDSYFSATKVHWLLQNVEGAIERANKGDLLMGTIDTWLIWKMTGGKSHLTDMTNASRTMLFNIKTLQWDHELLEIFGIPKTMLPEVVASSSHFGNCELDGYQIPISGVAGDQQAALFGQGCMEKGDAKNTYGTGCFLLMNQGQDFALSEHGLVTTLACSLDEKPVYAFEGSVFIAGAAVQWLRDGLELIETASETQSLAESVDTDDVVLVPAFVGLGTPYWDMYARGAVFGLSRDTGRAHFAKAALQSIAFQTRDIIEAMVKDGGLKPETLKVDGGATANEYLMQFQSDILDMEILKAKNAETTALGAAFLAGLQIGFWSVDDVSRLSSRGISYKPKMQEGKRNELYGNWSNAVSRTLGWLKK